MISLNDLNAVEACAEAFEFDYLDPATGEPTGIKFKVLGAQSNIVTKEVARLINDRRRKEAAKAAQQKLSIGPKSVDFEPVESDVEFGFRLAAVRLVGWTGISDEFTPENALKLCRSNREISNLITAQSDLMSNFTKTKPKD